MKIEFFPSNQQVADSIPYPEPAKNFLPQWYKKSSIKPLPLDNNDPAAEPKGLKSCTPFLDALTSGYIQKTWTDITIEFVDGVFSYKFGDGPTIMESRNSVNLPIGEKFYPIEFAWLMPWIPKTPSGYSVICSHPHNRVDLPFFTLTGIIDSDEFNHVGFGKFPFYIERNFVGIIPAGTPIIQITPIKQDNWNSMAHPYCEETQMKKEYKYFREYYNVYRNKFWKKKGYK